MKNGLIGLVLILAAIAMYCSLQSEPDPEPEEVQEPARTISPPTTTIEPQFELPTEEELAEPEVEEVVEETTTTTTGMRTPRSCNGTIDAAAASRVVARYRPAVRACYERQLKTNNLLQGTVNVRVTIGRSGSIEGVSVGGNLGSPEVFGCVRRLAQGWEFPPPTGGCAQVNAPFRLTPQN